MRVLGRGRRGFMLVEVGAAIFVMAAVLVLAVRLMAWGAAERAEIERRRLALCEAQNVVDRVAALPAAELTPETVEALGLGESVRAELPDGRIDVRLGPEDGPPAGVRIRVEVRWRDRAGGLTAPVRLTAWSYRSEEPRP